MKKKLIKLNLGCGKNLKKNFINIDFYQHKGFKIDLKCNLAKKIPLRSNYADYAYSSHLLEHLFWYQGLRFLKEIFRILKKNGKIRILVPDFKKIFKEYVDGNKDYFKVIKKNLNEKDYLYYKNLLRKPRNQISTSSFRNSSSTPPSWHNSVKKINIEKKILRARFFHHTIDIVNWFTHQHDEHKTLYDYEKMKSLLKDIGFKKIRKTSYKFSIDPKSKVRKKISLCVEGIK